MIYRVLTNTGKEFPTLLHELLSWIHKKCLGRGIVDQAMSASGFQKNPSGSLPGAKTIVVVGRYRFANSLDQWAISTWMTRDLPQMFYSTF